jgi:hypothetical protein
MPQPGLGRARATRAARDISTQSARVEGDTPVIFVPSMGVSAIFRHGHAQVVENYSTASYVRFLQRASAL